MGDFWDEMRAIEQSPNRDNASALIDSMVSTPWRELSYRDSIEFFNELLRLDELFPGLLVQAANTILGRIVSDSRSGRRQDQISKAQILHNLPSHASTDLLFSLVRNGCQDLDTRNAAVRILWSRQDMSDDQAVGVVRGLLGELLPEAEKGEHPANSFVVGLCYLLLNFKGRTSEDEDVARRVYGLHNRRETATTKQQVISWFRTQFTLGGLLEDALSRG